jgi:hypothetical protein
MPFIPAKDEKYSEKYNTDIACLHAVHGGCGSERPESDGHFRFEN